MQRAGSPLVSAWLAAFGAAFAEEHFDIEVSSFSAELERQPCLAGTAFASDEDERSGAALGQVLQLALKFPLLAAPAVESRPINVRSRPRSFGVEISICPEPPQSGLYVYGISDAFARILGQELQHEIVQRWWHALDQRRGQFWLDLPLLREQLIGSFEGRAATQQLVENAAERVQIGSSVDSLASRLFRSQVRERSLCLELGGEAFATDLASERRGQAEIHQNRPLLPQQKDVFRLQVAMNQAFAVQIRQRCAHAPDQLQALAQVFGSQIFPRLAHRSDGVQR